MTVPGRTDERAIFGLLGVKSGEEMVCGRGVELPEFSFLASQEMGLGAGDLSLPFQPSFPTYRNT